jgi:ubiquinone/menaquinone biosynthesis C-methylase UbiE
MSTALVERELNHAEPRDYALGYSANEFKRLEQQAALYHEMTEGLLRRAGIGAGMRVLDIGCGVGDVSLLAGALVGSRGAVLGIDRSEDGLQTARRRADAAGQPWVHFAAAEIDEFATNEKFDALIGRLVLMYLPDPAATLRRLRGYLRAGGIIVFQEMMTSLVCSTPEGPQFRQCKRWITEALQRAGAEIDMGGRLLATYHSAGLTTPRMIAAELVEGGPNSAVYGYMAASLRSLLPVLERAEL